MFFFRKKKKKVQEQEVVEVSEVEESQEETMIEQEVTTSDDSSAEPVKRKVVYHITKREDGKWQVKGTGQKRANKLFNTQKEAIEYTKTLSESTERGYMIHKADGKIRKKDYK